MEYCEGYRICRHCGFKVGARAITEGIKYSIGALNNKMIGHLRSHDPEPKSKFKRICLLCHGEELTNKVSHEICVFSSSEFVGLM